VLNYICVYSITFLMPFYLIQGRGLNPAAAGMLLTTQPILMAITAPISGGLSDKAGSRLPGMIGMAILSGGLCMLSGLRELTALWYAALALAVAGSGTGTLIHAKLTTAVRFNCNQGFGISTLASRCLAKQRTLFQQRFSHCDVMLLAWCQCKCQ
jgi:MFS family permease